MTKPHETRTFTNFILYSCVDENDMYDVFHTLQKALTKYLGRGMGDDTVTIMPQTRDSLDIIVTGERDKYTFEYIFKLNPERVSDNARDEVIVDTFTVPFDAETFQDQILGLVQFVQRNIHTVTDFHNMMLLTQKYGVAVKEEKEGEN